MISTKEMIRLENISVENNVSKLELMENAGKAVVDVLLDDSVGLFGDNVIGKSVLIFTYNGNNSGDGFVVARLLADKCKITVLFLGDEEKLANEAKTNFLRIKENSKLSIIKHINDLESSYDFIIDAMLGTGAKGKLREPVKSAVIKFNELGGTKICLDIPTGMDPDTGEVGNVFCSSDLIITFHDAKTGLKDFMHKVKIVDIGIKR